MGFEGTELEVVKGWSEGLLAGIEATGTVSLAAQQAAAVWVVVWAIASAPMVAPTVAAMAATTVAATVISMVDFPAKARVAIGM